MRFGRRTVALVAIITLVTVGCGGGDHGGATTSRGPSSDTDQSRAPLSDADRAVCHTFQDLHDPHVLLSIPHGHDVLLADLIREASAPGIRQDLSAAALAYAHAPGFTTEIHDAYERMVSLCS